MSRTTLANALKGAIASDSSLTSNADVTSAIQTRVFTFLKPGAATSGDDAAAGTDIAETPVFYNGTGATITITDVRYVCGNTGFTESATVYSTLTLNKRDSAGANSTSVATMKTDLVANGGVGTLTVGKQGAFTLTTTQADRVIAAGGVLCIAKTHASTGTVIPGGVIVVTYVEN